MRELDERHASSGEVDKLGLYLLKDRQRQRARARAEVVSSHAGNGRRYTCCYEV